MGKRGPALEFPAKVMLRMSAAQRGRLERIATRRGDTLTGTVRFLIETYEGERMAHVRADAEEREAALAETFKAQTELEDAILRSKERERRSAGVSDQVEATDRADLGKRYPAVVGLKDLG